MWLITYLQFSTKVETCNSQFSADFLEGSLVNDELMLIGSFCKDLRYFSTSCQAGVAVINHLQKIILTVTLNPICLVLEPSLKAQVVVCLILECPLELKDIRCSKNGTCPFMAL